MFLDFIPPGQDPGEAVAARAVALFTRRARHAARAVACPFQLHPRTWVGLLPGRGWWNIGLAAREAAFLKRLHAHSNTTASQSYGRGERSAVLLPTCSLWQSQTREPHTHRVARCVVPSARLRDDRQRACLLRQHQLCEERGRQHTHQDARCAHRPSSPGT
jgi:hypothetical protein